MKRIGAILAGLCLAGSGLALAGGGGKQHTQTGQSQQEQTGTTYGGSGMTTEQAGKQLEGTVVKADRKQVYLEHMGAVVPVKLTNKTRFEGISIRQAKDLKEGQEVRVAFEIEDKTQNVATVIMLASDQPSKMGEEPGTGGTGMQEDDTPTEPKDLSNPQEEESPF
jgi:hypothetical protein